MWMELFGFQPLSGKLQVIEVRMRRLMVVFSSVLLLVVSYPARAQEGATEGFGVHQEGVSRRQAIALSALFPGLGQLANGHRYKGTGLMVGEVTCLVVWLTSHADYNTQKEQFAIEQERYLALQNGGSFIGAEESWTRLKDKKDDLDGSHTRRRLFGALAVALYGYNLVDVLVLGGTESAVDRALSIAPLPGLRVPSVALVARF